MTPDQADMLIGKVQGLQATVTDSVYLSSALFDQLYETNELLTDQLDLTGHLSDQLDLMHATMAVQTDYLIWTFGVVAVILSFVAFIAGYKLARGR